MSTLSQKDYLLQIKNSMLLHFSHKDIYSTLKDVNQLFASGKEYGKTEEELCDELGSPKDFVNSLLQDSGHDKLIGYLAAWFISVFAVCTFIVYVLVTRNILLGCIITVLIPIYTWYLCGGFCLQELQNRPSKLGAGVVVFNLFGLVFVVAQQWIVFLLNDLPRIIGSDILRNCINKSYYISIILIIAFFCQLVSAICKLSGGHYLSMATLLLSCGIAFSMLLYTMFLKNYNAPTKNLFWCSAPCIVSIISSLLCSQYLHKKGKS